MPVALRKEPCVRLVASLEVGEAVAVSHRELDLELPGFWHNGVFFTSADRVLENIVGSAFEYSYEISLSNKVVTFYRHENTGKRRYTSPDRR